MVNLLKKEDNADSGPVNRCGGMNGEWSVEVAVKGILLLKA